MRSRSSEPSGARISPIRVLLTVLAVVFLAESIIMLGLRAAPRTFRESEGASLLDAILLVGVVSPVLWMLVVRPLRRMVIERGELLSRAMSIQEEERARLAHDLHDEIGQVQTALLLAARAVMSAQSPEQLRERAKLVHSLAVESMESTRRLARGLSPSVLTDFGLAAACERVCEDLSDAAGIPIHTAFSIGSTRFDPKVEIALYRVMQEALSNSLRHAGASELNVRLDLVRGVLELEVADDGQGIAPASHDESKRSGLGLASMRERIVLLGGRFEINSEPASGTTLRARLPVEITS